MYMHIAKEAPPVTFLNPNLSPQFNAILNCALAKKPADRYASAGELASALKAVVLSLELPVEKARSNPQPLNFLVEEALAVAQVVSPALGKKPALSPSSFSELAVAMVAVGCITFLMVVALLTLRS